MKKYKRGTSLYDFCISENKLWILEQFDVEKNDPLTAKDYTKSSDKKAWFKFENCGHSCLQRIADKTGKNSRLCPTCLNRGAIGKSLLSEYPDYAKMFDANRNGVFPEQVSFQNGKSYWWTCPRCNSKFKGKVSDVVNGKRVCNECSNKRRSFPEYCLAYYFLKIDRGREINKNINGYKFDFFLPKFNLVIEYDGYPWHNTLSAKKNDLIKDEICKTQNLTLFRMRDDRLDDLPLSSQIWKFTYDDNFSFLKNLGEKLSEILKTDNIRLDIDVKRDFSEIRKFQFDLDKKNSLAACIPTLTDYIDPENDKNGNPEYVNSSSQEIHFWLRHPTYKNLKWSMTSHHLFRRKEPFTQWIKMCLKMLERYPELEKQIVAYGNDIREKSSFNIECSCGKTFQKNYAALMGKRKVYMCSECLKEYRLNNLKNIQR